MSTFNGFVKEFPTIRSKYPSRLSHLSDVNSSEVDRFRQIPEKPLPVVGFLSHVHSDHLQGLESWGKIPLYCSPTTQQLLLHLETYPHRMNFSKGILECRKQHYKKLKSILRPIPTNSAATEIEIGLGHFIRVTLFDANHCAGAVMFLIEDGQRAILYTGDIRSESWWVNSLVRNPALSLYCSGIKRLDNMYLDTTHATENKQYRSFQSKADGIKELLEEILKFPKETVFHFNAWTLGYEDVWVAMSRALDTQVHVDDYRRTLYGSLVSATSSHSQYPEGPALVGFANGNHFQKGCLTVDESVRLHSCEPGTGCPISSSPSTVYIIPVISKGDDSDVLLEAGLGGSGGDLLYNHAFLELDDARSIELLLDLCNDRVESPTLRSNVREMIVRAAETSEQAMLLANVTLQGSGRDIEMDNFIDALVERAKVYDTDQTTCANKTVKSGTTWSNDRRRQIQFQYARHSSYEELCLLVAAFRPRDIYPCTTNWQEWSWASSVENLFGHLSDMVFAHDEEMASMETQRMAIKSNQRIGSPSDSQERRSSQGDEETYSQTSPCARHKHPYQIDTSYQTRAPPTPNITSSQLESKQRLAELRQAFEYPFKAIGGKSEKNIAICRPESASIQIGTMPEHNSASCHHQENEHVQRLLLCRTNCAGRHSDGTQLKPIELSDDAPPTNCSSQAQGDFLLDELPAPPSPCLLEMKEETKEETQLTLSDSYFESQLVDILPEGHAAKLRHRKQAYRDAQNLTDNWEQEYVLVSSGADHGEVELEL